MHEYDDNGGTYSINELRGMDPDKGLNIEYSNDRQSHDRERIRVCNFVMEHGYPNAWGAQVPVESGWNLELLDSLLRGYEDREVVTWLRFGWPVSRPPNIVDPVPTYKNHQSAVEFPEAINTYLNKEINRGRSVDHLMRFPLIVEWGSPLLVPGRRRIARIGGSSWISAGPQVDRSIQELKKTSSWASKSDLGSPHLMRLPRE